MLHILQKKLEKYLSKLYTNGYSVRTTLDPSIQIKAEEALIEGLEKLDKRQGWRGPISNFYSSDLTKEELFKYLQDVQKQLPKKRNAAIVTKVSRNFIDVLLNEGNKVKIEFKNASWVRPQTIKKDDKNRLNIHLGKKYKNFEQFISNGDIVVVKKNKNQNMTYYSLSQIPNVNGDCY